MPSKKTKNKTQFFEGFKESISKIVKWVSPPLKFLVRNSEPIRNWLIIVFTGILAFYTYRLFETAVNQAEASIDILGSSVKHRSDNRFHEFFVTANIINTSQITLAENIEIESRFDLRRV